MIARTWGVWLLGGLAAISCGQTRRTGPEPKRCGPTLACPADHSCSPSFECVPRVLDAAVRGDAGLSESRVPDGSVITAIDAGTPVPARGYRITGSLSVQPDTPARDYVLHDQRLDVLQARCSKVGDQTLCVSGSLHGLR